MQFFLTDRCLLSEKIGLCAASVGMMSIGLSLWVLMASVMHLILLVHAQDWSPVDAAFQAYPQISSGTLAVFDSRGLLYQTTKGTTNQASFTYPLPVASASKWVSASLIGKLVNNSVMSFDDHPQKYISWWTSNPSDKRSQMTLRQLLAFTAGFADDNDCTEWDNVTYVECCKMIYNGSIPFQPGTTFFYTSNHFKIAGLMAMIASGFSTWTQLWNNQIKQPLGLANSAIWTLAQPNNNENPAGTLIATPNDYAKWLTAYYRGQLFSDAIRAQLETDNTVGVTIAYSPWMFAVGPPRQSHYCQGHWLECDQSPFAASCAAARLHSSAGSLGTLPWIDRVNNYYGLLTTLNPPGSGDLSMNAMITIRPAILTALNASRASSSAAPFSSSARASSSSAAAARSSSSAAAVSSSTAPVASSSSASTGGLGASTNPDASSSSSAQPGGGDTGGQATSASATSVQAALAILLMVLCVFA